MGSDPSHNLTFNCHSSVFFIHPNLVFVIAWMSSSVTGQTHSTYTVTLSLVTGDRSFMCVFSRTVTALQLTWFHASFVSLNVRYVFFWSPSVSSYHLTLSMSILMYVSTSGKGVEVDSRVHVIIHKSLWIIGDWSLSRPGIRNVCASSFASLNGLDL